MKKIIVFVMVVIVGVATVGCSTLKYITKTTIARLDAKDLEWRQKFLDAAVSNFLAKVESGDIKILPDQELGDSGNSDQLDFSLLNFTYGGFKAGGAVITDQSPLISNLTFDKRSLYFKYDKGLSGWGLAHSEAGAICAVFFKNTEGKWIGGKFDWISTSRASRELKHCTTEPTYSNWTMAGIPNPCEAVFVIFDRTGRQRSNILKANWTR